MPYYAMVVVIEADDPDSACDMIGAAIDTSDIPDGTEYFTGTPWEVIGDDLNTDDCIASRP